MIERYTLNEDRKTRFQIRYVYLGMLALYIFLVDAVEIKGFLPSTGVLPSHLLRCDLSFNQSDRNKRH